MSTGSQLPVYTEEEVASHNTADSLWLIIEGKVYDVTEFIENHPGGREVLLDNAGKDATSAFLSIGHSEDAIQLRDTKYLIGTLKEGEKQECCSGTQMLKIGAVIVGVAAVGVGAYFAYKALKK